MRHKSRHTKHQLTGANRQHSVDLAGRVAVIVYAIGKYSVKITV